MSFNRQMWIELHLLQAADSGRLRSQREAAAELNLALGLINAYIKRCVRKGWMKVTHVPARRYAYFLTPTGFAEKARLSAEFLRSSLDVFRHARDEYALLFRQAAALGCRRIALVGLSDLTEVATLCALEAGVELAGVVEPEAGRERHLGLPVFARLADAPAGTDGLILTAMGGVEALPEGIQTELRGKLLLTPDLVSRRLLAGSAALRDPSTAGAAELPSDSMPRPAISRRREHRNPKQGPSGDRDLEVQQA